MGFSAEVLLTALALGSDQRAVQFSPSFQKSDYFPPKDACLQPGVTQETKEEQCL